MYDSVISQSLTLDDHWLTIVRGKSPRSLSSLKITSAAETSSIVPSQLVQYCPGKLLSTLAILDSLDSYDLGGRPR